MYKKEVRSLIGETSKIERIVIECNDEEVDVWELFENNDDFELVECFEWLEENYVVKSYDVKYNYITIYVEEK